MIGFCERHTCRHYHRRPRPQFSPCPDRRRRSGHQTIQEHAPVAASVIGGLAALLSAFIETGRCSTLAASFGFAQWPRNAASFPACLYLRGSAHWPRIAVDLPGACCAGPRRAAFYHRYDPHLFRLRRFAAFGRMLAHGDVFRFSRSVGRDGWQQSRLALSLVLTHPDCGPIAAGRLDDRFHPHRAWYDGRGPWKHRYGRRSSRGSSRLTIQACKFSPDARVRCWLPPLLLAALFQR